MNQHMKNVTSFATAMLLATLLGGCASASSSAPAAEEKTVAPAAADEGSDPAIKVETDNVSCTASDTERATERPCNAGELAFAVGHCHLHHGLEASQNIVGCMRSGNYIIYSYQP